MQTLSLDTPEKCAQPSLAAEPRSRHRASVPHHAGDKEKRWPALFLRSPILFSQPCPCMQMQAVTLADKVKENKSHNSLHSPNSLNSGIQEASPMSHPASKFVHNSDLSPSAVRLSPALSLPSARTLSFQALPLGPGWLVFGTGR